MLSTSRRAHARRGLRRSAIVASASVVAAMVPALALSSPSPAAAATAAVGTGSAWQASSARTGLSHDGNRRVLNPSSYRAYSLDDSTVDSQLARAPQEAASSAGANGARIVVPAPTGELVTFEVFETSVMEDGLAAAHPEIKTYAGRAVGFPDTIRIDVSPFGFHASVRGGDHPAWYVDPAYVNDGSLYLSYFGQDLPAPERGLVEPELPGGATGPIRSIGEGPDGLAKERTYRLALLTDPSYAEYVAPGLNDGSQDAASNSAVLAAKTTLMNRVNEIYGDDLGVRMVLIDDTDKLNLNTTAKITSAGGACGPIACYLTAGNPSLDPILANGCTSPLLTRTRLVIGQIVGAHSFDIGHIGLGIDGGGIAALGVVGGNNKAQGCTGLPDPTGDFYAIDYVAHEMGHQFAGNHTFNGTQLNCSGSNRSASASVEPGSGSSVMAYAGICWSDDLQPHTDPYFSQRSQTEIGSYINSALNDVNEVQSAGFTDFDGTDSFTIGIGAVTTAPIVRGQAGTTCTVVLPITCPFNATGIKDAIDKAQGNTAANTGVTVAGYFGQAFGDTGFQVTFGNAQAGTDVPMMVVTPTGFTAQVDDIAQGGPPTNGGSTLAVSANHNPAVTAPAGKTIPLRTPFTLTGSGTDSDGDPLIYLWEQNDRGAAAGTGLVDNVKKNGPLFRVFGKYADVTATGTLMYHSPGENHATASPTRTFPDMDQILAGTTNAATGTCPTPQASDYKGVGPNSALKNGPVLECYSEFLPTADYVGDGAAGNTEPSLNFRLTARDMGGAANVQGGGVDWADTKLRIDKTAGPFQVTSQAAPTSYGAGTTQTITWDVNNTDKPTLAPNVKISFSSDGGQTFDTVLAASTANDGSATVTLPFLDTTTGRIKIEAVGNYFFDVNDAPVTVTRAFTVNDTVPDDVDVQYSDPSGVSFTTSSDFGDVSATVDGSTPLPAGLTLTRTGFTAGALPSTPTFSMTGNVTAALGDYPVQIDVTDGTNSQSVEFTIHVAAEDATVTYTGPAVTQAPTGGNDVVSVPLSAHVTQAADGTLGDIAQATVTFKDTTANEVLCADVPVDASGDASCSYSADIPLQSNRSYSLELQVGGRFTGTGTGTMSVQIDSSDPDTTITSGPAEGSLLLATSTSIGFGSNESPVTFTCHFDGNVRPCASSPSNIGGLSAKTHQFTVYATDQAGNADATPAVRTFTVPMDDAALAATKGSWARGGDGNAFAGTISSSKKKGSTLSTTISGATSLTLIANTGKKGGKVNVFLNGQLLKTVSLKRPAAGQVLIPVASFAGATSGTVTIVNETKKSHKKKQRSVVIDGLGVTTGP